jgi:hypothetical protein
MYDLKLSEIFEFLAKQSQSHTAEDICTRLAFVAPHTFITLANIQRPDFPLPKGNNAIELFELYMKLKESRDQTEVLRIIFDPKKPVSENCAILQNWITTLQDGGML